MNKKFYIGMAFLLFSLFVISTAFRDREKEQSPIRQNWEYKELRTWRETGQEWSKRFEDDKQINVNSISVRLKELGSEGWELIAVTPISHASHDGYTFTNYEDSKQASTPSVAGFTNELRFTLKRPK